MVVSLVVLFYCELYIWVLVVDTVRTNFIGSFIGICYCPCRVESDRKVGQRKRASQTLRMKRKEMRCLRWLGLHVGDPGGPPDLKQVLRQRDASMLPSPSSPEHMAGDEDSS